MLEDDAIDGPVMMPEDDAIDGLVTVPEDDAAGSAIPIFDTRYLTISFRDHE
jgi:hypothetical protein